MFKDFFSKLKSACTEPTPAQNAIAPTQRRHRLAFKYEAHTASHQSSAGKTLKYRIIDCPQETSNQVAMPHQFTIRLADDTP